MNAATGRGNSVLTVAGWNDMINTVHHILT